MTEDDILLLEIEFKAAEEKVKEFKEHNDALISDCNRMREKSEEIEDYLLETEEFNLWLRAENEELKKQLQMAKNLGL